MNMSQAKIVLIIAFLGLNLLLLYQIRVDGAGGNPLFFADSERASGLEAALQQANLLLETDLPKGRMRVAQLEVKPWQPAAEETVRLFRDALAVGEDAALRQQQAAEIVENYRHEPGSILFNGYALTMAGEGQLTLRGAFAGLPPEQLRTAAETFRERIPFLSDFVYDYKQTKETGTKVFYRQEFSGFPLYAGYMQFHHKGADAGEDNVIITFYRLSPLGFAEQQREVIPPATALWRFLETYAAANADSAAIVEFSLGYYSEAHAAQFWEIAPVWRIRLDNGEVYYINAFTGYREG